MMNEERLDKNVIWYIKNEEDEEEDEESEEQQAITSKHSEDKRAVNIETGKTHYQQEDMAEEVN